MKADLFLIATFCGAQMIAAKVNIKGKNENKGVMLKLNRPVPGKNNFGRNEERLQRYEDSLKEGLRIDEMSTGDDLYVTIKGMSGDGSELENMFAQLLDDEGEIETAEYITTFYPVHSLPVAEAHNIERRRKRIKNSNQICYSNDIWPWQQFEYPEVEDLPADNFQNWHMQRISRQTKTPEDNPIPVRHLVEGGEGVIVYVVDTGVNEHPSFAGRVQHFYNYFDESQDDSGSGSKGKGKGKHPKVHNVQDAGDYSNHGTPVASLVAGVEFGAATGALIRNVKVFDNDGYGSSLSVFSGLFSIYQEVAQETKKRHKSAKRIINLSLSGPPSDAIDALLIALYNLDVVVVAAAGNQDPGGPWDACKTTPQRNPTVVTVGAVNQEDKMSHFSKRGTCVDIMAPGEQVFTASHQVDADKMLREGTSFSAPLVAGVMASLWSKQHLLTGRQVRAAVISASTPGELDGDAYGTPNLMLFAPITFMPLDITKGSLLAELRAFDALLGDEVNWDQIFTIKRGGGYYASGRRFHADASIEGWLDRGMKYNKDMYMNWLVGREDTYDSFVEWLGYQTNVWGLGLLTEWLRERYLQDSTYSTEGRNRYGGRRDGGEGPSILREAYTTFDAFKSYAQNARIWAKLAEDAWVAAKSTGYAGDFHTWILNGNYPGSSLYSAFVSAVEQAKFVASRATIHFDRRNRHLVRWAGNAVMIYTKRGGLNVVHPGEGTSETTQHTGLPGQLPASAAEFAQLIGYPQVNGWNEASEFGEWVGNQYIYEKRRRYRG